MGDDWQSIYRFAGSDIGYILDFQNYWGAAEISKIETTYRFPRKLIEISSNFIMQDPLQIRKNIRGMNEGVGFPLGEISAYTDTKSIDFMVERLRELPRDSTVYFIGRYTFDADLLDKNAYLRCSYSNAAQALEVRLPERPDLKMQFLTAHRSKGLQADHVFIINTRNGRMGFPSQIQDHPILDLLLESRDHYEFAEERRLFYVALTRAKKKAFLLTVDSRKSSFVQELEEVCGEQMKKERWECPLCGGKIVRKNGKYGQFYGCSNYRVNGCRFNRKA